MEPGVCEIYGLPVAGVYTVDANRSPNGPKKHLSVTIDDSPGFLLGGQRAFTLRFSSGLECADGQMAWRENQQAYTACLP